MYRWVRRSPVAARTEHAIDDDGTVVVIISRFPARDLDAPWAVHITGDQFDLPTGPLTRDDARTLAEHELTERTGQAWEPRTGWWP